MDCVGTICSQISFGWSLFWTGARNCGLDIVLLIYHASLNISIIIKNLKSLTRILASSSGTNSSCCFYIPNNDHSLLNHPNHDSLVYIPNTLNSSPDIHMVSKHVSISVG